MLVKGAPGGLGVRLIKLIEEVTTIVFIGFSNGRMGAVL